MSSSTSIVPGPAVDRITPAERPARKEDLPILDRISMRILSVLASLKLTVALFVLGIFIILVGTLAQVDMDMWQVIDEYFRTWVASIDVQVFFPRTWFPKWQNIPYRFWFPGGAAIGALMAINLLAAHLVRFKTQASRGQLLAGTLILLAGSAVTAYVISSGHNRTGLQGQPPFSWQTLWMMVQTAIAFTSAFALYSAYALRSRPASRKVEVYLYGATGVILGMVSIWSLLAKDNAYLGDSGMRILWQLIQATFCGVVLLVGSLLVFRKRGGIVVIHAGIGLMMFGQFYVAKYDVEEQIRIEEGQTRAYGEDVRQTELAIVDSSNPQEEQVVAIPRSVLLASLNQSAGASFSRRPPEVDERGVIRHPKLPFDLQLVEYFRNADLREIKAGVPNQATAGFGQRFMAVPLKPSSGTDMEGRIDLAAAYVRFLKKDGTGAIGTYLLSQLASLQNLNDKIELAGKTYEVALRFARNYKPYQLTLLDVRKDDYVGTSTPRNYSSDVRLVDASRNVDREIHIWMNNPLRYAGETFYQSGYAGPPDAPVETTTLSVVTNSGWLIPYVSCMIVIVGLAWHFTGTLMRFLRRPDAGETLSKWSLYSGGGIGVAALALALVHRFSRRPVAADARPARKRGPAGAGKQAAEAGGKAQDLPRATYDPSLEPITLGQALSAVAPWLVIAPFALALLASLSMGRTATDTMNLREFGRLPVIAEGRVKPFDTLARNTLRAISNRESFRDGDGKSQPAIRWLLDVITRPEVGEQHRVVRIDNLEVLDTLKLTRRKGNLYSVAEIRGGVEAFERQVGQAQRDAKEKGAENLTTFQRKLLELDRRVRTYTRIAASFQPPSLPPLPSREEFERDRATAEQKLSRFRDVYVAFVQGMDGIQPPLSIPTKATEGSMHQEADEWQPYAKAYAAAVIDAGLLGNSPPPALQAMNAILASYSEGQTQKFNEEVNRYHQLLRRDRPKELAAASSFWNRTVERLFGSFYGFEEFFNHVAPFFYCWFPYLGAAVLAALSWLVWRPAMLRSAWWLALFTFAVHTLALCARIYISGRPPVTNLYSSAVFIGWGVVLFCLVWEWLNRNGLPTFVGSLLGFSSLIVAHLLAADGDTFTVLQAVLDTQFWLATHVVLITLGYATTFLAGGIGVVYVLRGLITPTLTQAASKEMARMVYGTICFALFFSFFGTVLGGLWADDSWGRFWGWDPKENGALIIVLWNALVLHARWDGMVKDRGMAVLAVGGNIVTSWSWFGVNELGVGLHSYGFTEGVLLALAVFAGSQLLVIFAGCLPKSLWWSFTRQARAVA